MACSFQGNIYPSLLLSLSVSYPEYARCLTVVFHNLPDSGALQLRIDSDLFLQPLQVAVIAQAGSADPDPRAALEL